MAPGDTPPALNDLIYQWYGGSPSINDAQYQALLAAYEAGVNANVLIGAFADLLDAADGSVISVEDGVITITAGGGGGGGNVPTYLQTTDPVMGQPEKQSIDIDGSPTGGDYTLSLDVTTIGPIQWDAVTADVQAAFDDALGADVVTVTGDPPNWLVQWSENAPQPTLQVEANNLTGGTDPQPTIGVNQPGFAPVADPAIGSTWWTDNGAGGLPTLYTRETGQWTAMANLSFP